MLSVVPDAASGDDDSTHGTLPSSLIDEIAGEGALAEALQVEVDAYIAAFADEWDTDKPQDHASWRASQPEICSGDQ